MDLNITDLIGYLAAFLTTASFVPQAIQTIKTKDTNGISLLMYIMFTAGVFTWTIFGFLIDASSIIVGNIVAFILASIILYIKIKNVRNKSDD